MAQTKKDYVKQNFNYRKLLAGRDYIFDIIDQKLSISQLYDRYDIDNDVLLNDLIYFNFAVFQGNEERYFEECLKVKYEELLRAKIEDITAKFKSVEDNMERRKLLENLAEINKKLKDKNLEEFND